MTVALLGGPVDHENVALTLEVERLTGELDTATTEADDLRGKMERVTALLDRSGSIPKSKLREALS